MCSILGPLGHDSCTYSPGCFQSKVSKFLVVAGVLVVATEQILKRRKKRKSPVVVGYLHKIIRGAALE